MKKILDMVCLDFYKLSKPLCESLNTPTHYLPRALMQKVLPGEIQMAGSSSPSHLYLKEVFPDCHIKEQVSTSPSFLF